MRFAMSGKHEEKVMKCKLWLVGALVLMSIALVGCSSDDDPVNVETKYDFSEILADYAEFVIVETYAKMRDECTTLQTACEALQASPSQPAVDTAAAAWIAARAPWEVSEAFLFGPAGFMGLDPSLDSWPVDTTQLESVLSSNFALTPEFIADGLGAALRGYHTLEYLLFRDGQPRPVATISAREREYLVACSNVLKDDATSLFEAWATGIDGGTPFQDEFKNAGQVGSRYPSQVAAVQEAVEGMIAICDEVANGKIADPFDEVNTTLVESQFSFNSLTDFQDNLRGVRNGYLGEHHESSSDGQGIGVFVADQDEELDQRLRQEIDAAIAAIAAIPEPFRNNLDAVAEIEAAQAAISTVMNSLANDVLPLVFN